MAGSLIVIGVGIRIVGQLTMEALSWMERAEALPYLVADPAAERLIQTLNPRAARSLFTHYQDGGPRQTAYDAIVDDVLTSVRAGQLTVFACYGHPSVCAYAPLEAVNRARSEGFSATMLPGVSSLDCLFADLGVDPVQEGCHIYEATRFLEGGIQPDPSAHLILLQLAALGDSHHRTDGFSPQLTPLVQYLSTLYPPDHVVTLYEAASRLNIPHRATHATLASITAASLTPATTLYVPPIGSRRRSSLGS